MTDNWPACIAFTLEVEGGYVVDDGGPTNHGITISTLSDWLGRAATVDEVKCLTQSQAEAIYRANYWDAVRGDDLPAGVDLMLFDFGVPSGPRVAITQAQRVLRVATDGDLGPITLKAIRDQYAKSRRDLISALADRQADFYRALSKFPRYGHGWLNRLDRRETLAKDMAMKANP